MHIKQNKQKLQINPSIHKNNTNKKHIYNPDIFKLVDKMTKVSFWRKKMQYCVSTGKQNNASLHARSCNFYVTCD